MINLKKLPALFMAMTLMATFVLGGCSSSKEDKDSDKKSNKSIAEVLGTDSKRPVNTTAKVPDAMTEPTEPEETIQPMIVRDTDIGIALPTKDLRRYAYDGDFMVESFTDLGYTTSLQYANNDVGTQVDQVRNMIIGGCEVVIIMPIDPASMADVLELAEEYDTEIISYDRLIMNSDNVDFYVTFDYYRVGTMQAEYIVDALELDKEEGVYNIEIFAGDPGDSHANYFYMGAMDVLSPYIESGKLNISSNQENFADVAIPAWSSEQAQLRMDSILANYYADILTIDAVLCPNDSTAYGVIQSLKTNYGGTWPVITGQDCDIVNVGFMREGYQSMSVFKDTRVLVSQVVAMTAAIFRGEEVPVNDYDFAYNGVKTVPAYLCEPTLVDAYNYETILIDSGYYTREQLGL